MPCSVMRFADDVHDIADKRKSDRDGEVVGLRAMATRGRSSVTDLGESDIEAS